jgi:hypothetical protein
MRPRLALAIGAVFAFVPGLLFVIAPAQMLSALGLDMPPEALINARDTGVLLMGVGIIDWLARDAVGAPLRGLLWGNIFIRAAAIVVNLWELNAGLLPGISDGAIIGLLGLSIALIIVFALALRRA